MSALAGVRARAEAVIDPAKERGKNRAQTGFFFYLPDNGLGQRFTEIPLAAD
jgi:hypothetical protein